MKGLIRTITLLWSLILTKGDDTVTCLVSQNCVLPCQSSYHDVIHWQKVDSDKPSNVHSFYSGSDQLGHQDEAYRDRTSLFSDQISNGNISLILREVRIQDRGRFKCYTAITSANKEAFVNVNVKAPIKSVDIKMTDGDIICKTSEVYPEPRISWTIDGNLNSFPTEKKTDSKGLYSLASTVPAQSVQDSLTYTCSISFEDGTQTYSASLTHKETEIISGQHIMVRCPESQEKPENFTLTLTFEGSSTVLSYNSQTSQQDMKWNGMDVKIIHEGNITLFKLDSEKHSGTYTCERITTQSRQLMQTSVHIKSASTTGIIIGVVCILAVVAAVVIFLMKQYVFKRPQNNGQQPKSTGPTENGQNNETHKLSDPLVSFKQANSQEQEEGNELMAKKQANMI